jgi:hypothetical protein
MKTLKIAIALSLIFAIILVACKKKYSGETNIDTNRVSEKLTVEYAKSYHQSFENKYGNYDLIKISGKTEKNFKHVDFSRAYIGENETSFFVEAPISYTTRQISLRNSSSIPTSTLEKMFSYSSDRLVVYKDKISGMISEKIVTIIPSIDYLSNGHKNLSHNHYQSMVNDFSGYVSYKDWKGQFLSSQYYDKGLASNGVTRQPRNYLKIQQVNSTNCEEGFIYTGYVNCEDYDADGNGVNCDYVIIATKTQICEYVPPHTHPSPLPPANDPYWDGYPDPIPDPESVCPSGPRQVESPVSFVTTSGSSFSLIFIDACFCQGYSWVIFEDITTGIEYSVPITNQNFLVSGCTYYWETKSQIPDNIPNGQYYIKVNLDGDVFYHQFDNATGTIIKRFKHTISR